MAFSEPPDNPMIRDTLLRLAHDYPRATSEPFRGHTLAAWIRDDVPESFGRILPDDSQVVVEASAGKGNWVKGPWIAFLDPSITESAQEGHYVVYLFSLRMQSVALSLNQGITQVRKELGTVVARKVLSTRASILAARLPGQLGDRFSSAPIDLGDPKSGSLLEMYQCGHAVGTQYGIDSLPSNEVLIEDLLAMLNLCQTATARGGTTGIDSSTHQDPSEPTDMTLVEKRRIRQHERWERNPRLAAEAKRVHGTMCQVCGFDFAKTYGELGDGYIEAHHKVPFSELPETGKVSLSAKDDFAVVCANCHRMLHRKGSPPTYEEFVERYATSRASRK